MRSRQDSVVCFLLYCLRTVNHIFLECLHLIPASNFSLFLHTNLGTVLFCNFIPILLYFIILLPVLSDFAARPSCALYTAPATFFYSNFRPILPYFSMSLQLCSSSYLTGLTPSIFPWTTRYLLSSISMPITTAATSKAATTATAAVEQEQLNTSHRLWQKKMWSQLITSARITRATVMRDM